MKKKLLFILILAFGLTSCDLLKVGDADKEPQLPPITNTGQNTFGAKVNGKIMVVNDIVKLTAIHQFPDALNIGGGYIDPKKNIDQRIQMSINGEEVKVGTYEISSQNTDTREFAYIDDASNCIYLKSFNSSTKYEGTLEIVYLDRANTIISGIFSFRISVDGCQDINVTDGRFDLKYID
ncbi:hypothetical protein [Roseivirga sp. UBA1976]|uniref:hypothetical protein n=1 Tax=Roseivirga sp. UBA1976 TaxID=1947386 RepID=UPI00257C6424|nr:hypothetical protein [Roseivirga sp. UBA1976]|tara:strand:+ start:37 stop:576 length:540 start_codon:yes stop_codon:yes gene_type:complete